MKGGCEKNSHSRSLVSCHWSLVKGRQPVSGRDGLSSGKPLHRWGQGISFNRLDGIAIDPVYAFYLPARAERTIYFLHCQYTTAKTAVAMIQLTG